MEVRYASYCSYRIRYHVVFVVKYRKDLLTDEVSKYLKEILLGIGKRYYLQFHAMGTDEDHLHILVEAAPRYSPSQVMMICKSITAKETFKRFPKLREELWGGHFWTEGGHIDTVGDGYGEEQMKEYIRKQGGDPNQLKLISF
ncbi:IS200/IS605 family transposase [Candidatus Woesearchaeota archaeon]|nr:IS200/IS605 family transposase [Candidatus Woesearchaeota archaeon]HIH38472.1 IS200/IS605 family transposase [Candidatus Woesearchaeota archaeon]HIH49788.1 IS200/IS605 family transposase [Candidatus Woesearchaeota archaeon]HIJ03485.1 IS200/IS605 family transposase [Candidatus Woesearchaeota archaeon]